MEQTYIHIKNSLGQRFCTIRYLENNNLILIVWRGPGSENSISQVKSSIVEMLVRYRCPAIINDVQGFFTGPTEALLHMDWELEAHSLGVRYLAHNLSPNAHCPAIQPATESRPEVRYYNNMVDAAAWINQELTPDL